MSQSNHAHSEKTEHTYDDSLDIYKKIGKAFLDEYAFDVNSTTVLDIACGTRLVSLELMRHTKKIVGVDVDPDMVDRYNSNISKEGISPDKMRAVCAELTGAYNKLKGHKFDVCSMAYPGFPSIAELTRALASSLKPGGTLLLADHALAALPVPEMKRPVSHKHGFSEATVREAFDSACLTQFSYRTPVRFSEDDPCSAVFVASGKKPAAKKWMRGTNVNVLIKSFVR
ncbi:hypothetical protein M0805_006419 [Coniferiporia weirii]|nr:hypothetical protein M0805_006419 [Coniferiporia weirii]